MVVEDDIDQVLKQEDAEFVKDQEIDRILRAFKLDAYAVMGILPGCTPAEIRKTFRSKSLLIHPDKTKNERAPEAFDRLKKAQGELMDDKMREELDSAIATARRMLIDEKGWTIHHPDLTTPAFYEELRAKSRDVLIEDELARRRKRVIQMAEEGRQRAEEEAQEIARKRKREADQHWENTRDDRVGDWRRFSGQTAGNDPPKKKIKKKIKVLG